MKAHIPLDDEDRMPWLETIKKQMFKLRQDGSSAVIACSALKASYRKQLQSRNNEVIFIYLKGSYELIEERLRKRKNHFFDAALLSSQFSTLEEPENTFTVDISSSPDKITDVIIKKKVEVL